MKNFNTQIKLTSRFVGLYLKAYYNQDTTAMWILSLEAEYEAEYE